jgi:hypothetical protein
MKLYSYTVYSYRILHLYNVLELYSYTWFDLQDLLGCDMLLFPNLYGFKLVIVGQNLLIL